MAFLTRLRSFSSATETTPGQAVPVSGQLNDIRVWELAISNLTVEPDMDPSKYATGDLFLGESIPGPQSAQITFNTKFWAEASGIEPDWTKFVKAAGCAVSGLTNGDFAIYPSKYTLEDSLTIGIYDLEGTSVPSGLHYDFTGAIGNCTISTEGTGKPYLMAWEFTGALNDIQDIAESDIPVYSGSSVIPDRFLNGSGTIGSNSVCISTMEFAFGNTITPIQCQNSETGYKSFLITAQESMLTINPLLQSNSEYDFWSKWVDGTIEPVVIETEQFKLEVPRAQITSASVEDADGLLRTTLTMRPLRASTEGDYKYAPWVLTVKST